MLPTDEELSRIANVTRADDWPYAGVLAAEVIRLRAESAANMDGWKAALRSATGFYSAIVVKLIQFFPADSPDLEWDVLPGTVAQLAQERDEARKKVADLRAQLQAAREDHAADLRKAADEFASCIAEERKVIDALESRLAATWPKGDE